MKKIFVDALSIINNYDGSSGYRLGNVVESGAENIVASPYFWIDCSDEVNDCNSCLHYYDTNLNSIVSIPVELRIDIDALLDELLLIETT